MLDIDVKRRQGNFIIDTAFQSEDVGVTAIFGSSGAGKTSVINMIAGLSRPDKGRIVAGERCLYDSSSGINLSPERRHIGYIFQEGRLFPHLSVQANLEYGMRLTEKKRRYVRFDEVVQLLGLEQLIERRPVGLSGGEKQRVAIGRALLTSPSLLLMDEPLASLDDARKDEVLPFIARLSRRFSLPILYVSHSVDEIFALADSVVVMEAGKVAATGRIEDIVGRRETAHLLGYAESGVMLLTTVISHDPGRGLTALGFRGGTLMLPRLESPVGARVRVRIKAGNVALSLEPPQRTSLHNILPALVEEVGPGHGQLVDVRLDIGSPLLARITRSALQDLELKPGARVYALVKSLSVSHSDLS